jgi:YidC/Oxa1 family membrane protein insertase
MDRKAWIIIIICLTGLVWSQYEAHKQTKVYQAALAAEKAKAGPKPTETSGAAASIAATPAAVAAVSDTPAAAPILPATTKKLSTPQAEYTFTTAGGIQQIELLTHKAENGARVVLNGTSEAPIGSISEQPGQWPKTNEAIQEVSDKAISLESILPTGVQIRKTFTLGKSDVIKDDFQIKYDVTFSNPGVAKLEVKPWYVHTGAAAPIHQNDQSHLLLRTGGNPRNRLWNPLGGHEESILRLLAPAFGRPAR